jgi:bacteriophage N4 adsorption protein B
MLVIEIIGGMRDELLLFCALCFLIGAIDDACIDAIWFVRCIFRKLRYYRQTPPLNVSGLPLASRPGRLAIFVATWKEAGVIGNMLSRCQLAWRGYENHCIYVGCYPNDLAGIAAIAAQEEQNPHVKMVILDHSGPTTKADCLNHLWRQMEADERADGFKYKAVILHDAEDHVHCDELRLYDLLIEKAAAVQLPVIPVHVPGSRWISGHYCDEFAEAHGKLLVVREAIGASVPLAGVGCAIDRHLLGKIALSSHLNPFDTDSLTEDYELGFKIAENGGRTMFARICDMNGDIIGTRACFPNTLNAATRQKSRWITGIALAGWDRIGWRGSIANQWMQLHDRRAVFSAFVLVIAYLCIILSGILALCELASVPYHQPISDGLWGTLLINSAFLYWRMTIRAAFVSANYGYKEAVFSVPRMFIANMIAIIAARRAVFAYLAHLFGQSLVWDKTEHRHFPAHYLPVSESIDER